MLKVFRSPSIAGVLAISIFFGAVVPIRSAHAFIFPTKRWHLCVAKMTSSASFFEGVGDNSVNTVNAQDDLKQFRLHTLQQKDVEASSEEVSARSINVGPKTSKQIAQRIFAIEKYSKTENSIQLGITLTGEERIQKYFQDLQEEVNYLNRRTIISSIAEGFVYWKTLTGMWNLGLVAVRHWVFKSNTDTIHWGVATSLMGLFGLYSFFARDWSPHRGIKTFKNILKKKEPGTWAFNSSTMTVMSYFIQKAMDEESPNSAIFELRNLVDIAHLNLPIRGIRIRLRDPESGELSDVSYDDPKNPASEQWVFLDQLLQIDADGKPKLTLFVRTSVSKPEPPKGPRKKDSFLDRFGSFEPVSEH